MADYSLNINNQTYNVEIKEETTLLWVLREHLGLTGTKYGCGIALCGSCTVHVDGKPMRSCTLPISSLKKDQKITTIEGLSPNGDHEIQKAWIEAQAPQCGYCQSGQIMQAAALLAENPSPTREEIKIYMNGNLCRCGTYLRIVKAIEIAAEKTSQKP
ncbi:(2Fe-2S)-binding protein [uncultured Eudoraea sp.]|uniref:(2Fe-2S)-binding protein n=1 Tax=uncultured Eudoraea sp. TaxID=1035614 RepID=UPI002636BD27|nr:(2Fe-2S)-binding protein [uncultured Eudoraea sp.]